MRLIALLALLCLLAFAQRAQAEVRLARSTSTQRATVRKLAIANRTC